MAREVERQLKQLKSDEAEAEDTEKAVESYILSVLEKLATDKKASKKVSVSDTNPSSSALNSILKRVRNKTSNES